MGSAAAEGSGARVEDAAVLGAVLDISQLKRFVVVMTHEEIPLERLILGGEAVEGRNVVVERETVDVGLNGIAAGELAGIAAGLEDDDTASGLGETRRDRAAAGAGAYDHILGIDRRLVRFPGQSRVSISHGLTLRTAVQSDPDV